MEEALDNNTLRSTLSKRRIIIVRGFFAAGQFAVKKMLVSVRLGFFSIFYGELSYGEKY